MSLCFVINMTAQNDSIRQEKPKNERINYLGINGGLTTGVGMSYIYCPRKNGIQVTFLPLLDKDVAMFSAALTYLRFFSESEKVSFYFFLGNHLTNFLSDDKVIYNIGIGPGIEAGDDIFKVHFSAGYAVLSIPDNAMSRPTAELGFFFKF